ncbi:MAG: hypothetical protein LBF62_05090 [Tannerellaceae bacterium]|jgi:ligand-binding sensor domain-containing protein|nr:hypothetical protein [Tannerellaceae bacterium]
MLLKRIKYTLAILIACTFCLYAGDIAVRRIPVAEQLPSNTVYRMFQDKEGYIWLGTQNGFCRYDGYEMKSFRSEVTGPTFPSNFITGGFAEDTLNHTLWIGTEKGVLILDIHTCTAILPDTVLLGGAPVRQILYDAGDVWVCSDLGLSPAATNRLSVMALPGNARRNHHLGAVKFLYTFRRFRRK